MNQQNGYEDATACYQLIILLACDDAPALLTMDDRDLWTSKRRHRKSGWVDRLLFKENIDVVKKVVIGRSFLWPNIFSILGVEGHILRAIRFRRL